MSVCDQNDLNILLEVPDEELNVNVDPMKMVRVFENIISNAIRYSNKQSSIDVRTSNHKNNAIVELKMKASL